jgi:hypothetical protein
MEREIVFNDLIDEVEDAIWIFLYEYYRKTGVYIELGNEMSELIKTILGAKQGGPLSPWLFSRYIRKLIKMIKESDYGCKIDTIRVGIIAYADDLVLLSNTATGLQKMMDMCKRYGDERSITFNPKKTVVMIFGNKKQREQKLDIWLCEEKVKRVSEFKYLGIMICEKLGTNLHLEIRKNKSVASSYGLYKSGLNNEYTDPLVKSQLIKTYCRPTLLYGIENCYLSRRQISELETIDGIMLKRAMNMAKFYRYKDLQLAIDMDPMVKVIQKLKLNFFVRICNNNITRRITEYLLNVKDKIRKTLLDEIKEIVDIDGDINKINNFFNFIK